MDCVRKTFFNPLATSKAQIRQILQDLPNGSAHPFSPEGILLCRTENGVEEIDISPYPEDYFFNAVDLGEMGEVLLRRMAGFQSHLGVFNDFQIQQAPSSTFKVPLVKDQITILAVSERTPTYYDFCFADHLQNACCWLARDTFPGMTHSGDILNEQDLLDYVKINPETLTEKKLCVFISGYQKTPITRFLGTNPALLVADHVDKVLYIIPVPLDAATIGNATICCPLVIKKQGESLICSILPKATTDTNLMCHKNTIVSPCFVEAIKRADFTVSSRSAPPRPKVTSDAALRENVDTDTQLRDSIRAKGNVVIATQSANIPTTLRSSATQVLRFGSGLEFEASDKHREGKPSAVVLPCIFGSQLQGPILLATGKIPLSTPFTDDLALRDYYISRKNIVVLVDDSMTDNARNLAPAYRMNALFVIQLATMTKPKDSDALLSLLNATNINAVTALAGPQALVLVQLGNSYYFYRGLANREFLNTSGLAFGTDVSEVVRAAGFDVLTDPNVERIVNLDDANKILLPASGQLVKLQDLPKLFQESTIDAIAAMDQDIYAAVPQLQSLLDQKGLGELSQTLVSALSKKASDDTDEQRKTYIKFITREYDAADPASVVMKERMLGDLRKRTKAVQKALEPAISSLSSMVSSQTTSKRTHDLQRLVRQAKIQSNVENAKSMTFETLCEYLETHAADMGVMLLNIEEVPYRELLTNLKTGVIDATPVCEIDDRILYLEGLDAGIIMEQSQSHHSGPLCNQSGPMQPIMALPYLNQTKGHGSMLAWCNEPHIATLRILMRTTLSQAVASREHNIQPADPETGYLMSALLMAAMWKLAAMRTSIPTVVDRAEDTVTKLMRGLFGNLLTIAGAGVQPLSMVWQLFGLEPRLELPAAGVDWVWYEVVVALYPYTGWPLKQFHCNLEKLLDKAIIRVVTKNEKVTELRRNRMAEMINYCKLRNVQLEQSRTIVTAMMRMLTTEDADVPAIALRLLKRLPGRLERQTHGYAKTIQYLHHLAGGGVRRVQDDLVAAKTYTKRSATYAELKSQVSDACAAGNWDKVKERCQELMYKHAGVAAVWQVQPEQLKFQNFAAYEGLENAEFGDEVPQEVKSRNLELTRQILSDAEKSRVPWQVGKQGEYGDKIEPLDETLLHEILTGEKLEAQVAIADADKSAVRVEQLTLAGQEAVIDFADFDETVESSFIMAMQKELSTEDVCELLNIPTSAMRVIGRALNPDFEWDTVADNFKAVVLDLLKNRSKRAERRPAMGLVGQGRKRLEGV